MRDAERLFEASDHHSGAEGRKLDLLVLAELRGDEAEMRRFVILYPKGPDFVRPSRLIHAGLLEDARATLKAPAPLANFGAGRLALAHGQLLMLDNRVEGALT